MKKIIITIMTTAMILGTAFAVAPKEDSKLDNAFVVDTFTIMQDPGDGGRG